MVRLFHEVSWMEVCCDDFGCRAKEGKTCWSVGCLSAMALIRTVLKSVSLRCSVDVGVGLTKVGASEINAVILFWHTI